MFIITHSFKRATTKCCTLIHSQARIQTLYLRGVSCPDTKGHLEFRWVSNILAAPTGHRAQAAEGGDKEDVVAQTTDV